MGGTPRLGELEERGLLVPTEQGGAARLATGRGRHESAFSMAVT